jgi:hypothetical protein
VSAAPCLEGALNGVVVGTAAAPDTADATISATLAKLTASKVSGAEWAVLVSVETRLVDGRVLGGGCSADTLNRILDCVLAPVAGAAAFLVNAPPPSGCCACPPIPLALFPTPMRPLPALCLPAPQAVAPFAYVPTGAGGSPPQVTLMAINAWLGNYGGSIAGIVLGELPAAFDEDAIGFYATLAAHVRSFGKLVAFNASSRLDCAAAALADVVVGFEGSYRGWLDARNDGSLLPACRGDVAAAAPAPLPAPAPAPAPGPVYVGAITR